MGSVVLVADETGAARRDVIYGVFGASHGAGWLFAADCDVLAVGSVVSLQRLRTVVPRGSVELAGPHQIRQQLHLAEASAGGFRLLEFAR